MHTQSKYEIIIYWSNQDDCFIAETPELPGCMADGKTYQEVITNLEAVIEEWLETAREENWPIPEPQGHLLHA